MATSDRSTNFLSFKIRTNEERIKKVTLKWPHIDNDRKTSLQGTTIRIFPRAGEKTSFKNLKRIPDLNIKVAKHHIFRIATLVYISPPTAMLFCLALVMQPQ